MKILYVFRSLAVWGGIERILVEKMNQLVSMYDYDVYMLTSDQGNHPVPYKLDKRVHLKDLEIGFHRQYSYGALKRLVMSFQMRKLFEYRLAEQIRMIKPDVIVCVATSYADSVLRVAENVPVVVESHSICKHTFSRKGLRQRWRSRSLRKQIEKARMIVALTRGDADDWRKLYPRVSVIPNMAHLNKKAHYSSLSQKRVIFVGRFDYQKRAMEIIRIWQKVWSQHTDWHLDIYGEGEEQQQVEALAEKLNMNIHVHQPTKRIFDAYRASTFLVLTSLFEPFGLVMPEAMSCGLPVVAYDCPYGPSSIISDEKDGFLVPMNDADAFAGRMDLLMTDQNLLSMMSQNAIISSQRYSPDVIMPMWASLFEKL